MAIKLTLFILILMFSGIVWTVRKLQERAAVKRARDEQMRRRLEELRTGRVEDTGEATVMIPSGAGSPGPMSHQEATRRLQELAERRRQQLDELRRRAAGQGGGSTAPTAQPAPAAQQYPPQPQYSPAPQPTAQPKAPQPVRRASPLPTRQQAPRQSAPARPSARPQASRSARPAPAKASGKRAAAPKRQQVEQIDETEQRARQEAARALAGDRPAKPALPVPARAAGKAMVPTGRAAASEWRRIIMLREVLSPPVAIREQDREVI